jgi:hypothetical protein
MFLVMLVTYYAYFVYIIKLFLSYLLSYSRAPAQQACRILLGQNSKKYNSNQGGRSHFFIFNIAKSDKSLHGSIE